MQTRSALWQSLVSSGNYSALTTIRVDGQYTYDYSYITELKTTIETQASSSDYGYPSVGDCVSAQLDLTMRRPSVTFPRAAKIEVFVNLTDGTQTTTDNLPKGTFYIDTREIDSANDTVYDYDTLKITAYDCMMKAERIYNVDASSESNWPKTDLVVVQEIASRLGVNLNSTTASILNKSYSIQYPGYGDSGCTLREVLADIGAMYCGNWYISDANELKLMQLNETRSVDQVIDKYDETKTGVTTSTYDRVMVNIDEEDYLIAPTHSGYDNWVEDHAYVSGDHVVHDSYYYELLTPHTSGSEFDETKWKKENIFVFDSMWAVQATATNVYAQIQNYIYKGIEVTNAIIDPALEIGDKITVDTTTTYVFNRSIEFDYILTASLKAPFENEVDHEFDYSLSSGSSLTRTINKLKTNFTVQNGKIEGLIEGQIRTWSGSTLPTGVVFHTGDLYYCTAAHSDFKAETWYRYDGSDWEETTASVDVAPSWSSDTTYSKNEVVTGSDGNWYTSVNSSNTGNDPTTSSGWWTKCNYITDTAKSQILQELDTIQLSVEQGSNGSYIQIKSNGINWKTSGDSYFYTNSAHFSGELEAAKVISNGDGFAIKDDNGTTVGFIGPGKGSTGILETTGVTLHAVINSTAWAAGTEYLIGNYVAHGNDCYLCKVGHTSVDFDTDLEAGYWKLYAKGTSDKFPDPNRFIICTTGGILLQDGDYGILIMSSGCYTVYQGAMTRIGTAVFA